jgi:hypothetical protein
MSDRPTPPDPFARKAPVAPEPQKPSLTEALSSFAPRPIDAAIPQLTPVVPNAPDTGRGGRPRRRGDPETRSKTVNFRMKPSEQARLNALCDTLNKSIPDTIMVLLEHYQATTGR